MADKSAFVPVEATGGLGTRPAELDIDIDDDYFGGGKKQQQQQQSPPLPPPPPPPPPPPKKPSDTKKVYPV